MLSFLFSAWYTLDIVVSGNELSVGGQTMLIDVQHEKQSWHQLDAYVTSAVSSWEWVLTFV